MLSCRSSPSFCALGRQPKRQVFWLCWDRYLTVQSAIRRVELCRALEFETDAALDEFRAKPTTWQVVDFWPAALRPCQLEVRRAAIRDAPSDLDRAIGNRQGAVFRCVGRKLVNNQRKKEGGLWLQHHRRSVGRHLCSVCRER